MKKLVLLLVLGAATTPAWSAPTKTLSKLQKAPLEWLTFREESTSRKFSERVAAIQYLLRARGFYSGKVDGIYGPQTTRAVKAFQKQKGLRVDGVAGPQTLPRLVLTVKRGSRGDAVRAAQILARSTMGHAGETPNKALKIDGVFGAQTEKAVKTSQVYENFFDKLLVADGVMESRTWCLLLGGDVVGQRT